jgi:hypothetical protein
LTHPDLSDAPDAEARFAVLEAAYRRALVGAEGPLLEPAASSTVRITVHDDPTPRRAATGATIPIAAQATPRKIEVQAGRGETQQVGQSEQSARGESSGGESPSQ